MWASGFLYQLRRLRSAEGIRELFTKAETWVQDQVFALVDPIKQLGGK